MKLPLGVASPIGLLWLLLVPQLAAQTTLAGVVRSAESGAPLPSAVVQVSPDNGGPAATTLTNQSGRYQFSGLAAGSYTVTVSVTGYGTGRVEDLQVASGQAATADFDLETRAIDLDPIVVSASRREERALDAPARVEVIGPQIIEEQPAIQPTEHLKGLAGVDIVSQGLQSSNVVARGFNNIFSGALLALTDHRIAAIPSLRVNALYMVPATNEDIERMEVVLGPGSALYGPNTANGVLHMFTRSPLTYQGSTITLTGGERGVFQGTARTAHLVNENLGLKLSGQYFRGDEWEYTDPAEQLARARALTADPQTRVGLRDFDTARWAVDGRVDWRVTPAATAIFSGGRSTTSQGIELTGLGAAQVKDWSYSYLQARFNAGGLFAQAYLNTSNAGETYLLRDGASIVDESRFFVAQIQHSVSPLDWQDFTYGADYLRTIPETGGTIHGRFEDVDDFTEIGAFLQSETTLGRRFDVVFAGRVDRHSEVDATVFSPRAALVFRASQTHTFRASYNRAYSNPGSVQLFLDLNAGPAPGPLGALGYSIRARGTGRSGFSFRTANGEYVMRSPFAADADLQVINPANVWQNQVRGAAAAAVAQGQLSQAQAQALVQFLLPRAPADAAVYGLDPVSTNVAPFTPPEDFPGIRESNVTTFELGYKGLVAGRLLVAADLWHARRDNFISPLIPPSGFVLINPQQVVAHTTPLLQGFLIAGGVPAAQAQALAARLAAGLASIPAGVVSSPDVAAAGANLLVSYRNFGQIDLWGSDLSATALVGNWSLGLAASLVSDDHFRSEGQIITLNAPELKGNVSVGYRDAERGFNADARVRYSAGFPVNSGVFVGIQCIEPNGIGECVRSYTLADFTLGYDLPRLSGATVQLTVQNIFDTEYRSFVGVPEIGRLALLRVKYDF